MRGKPGKQRVLVKRLKAGLKADETGNKANSLIFLHQYRFNIPLTYLVTTRAYERYRKEGVAVLDQLREEVGKLPDLAYAVRSSTSVEDSQEFSFAGQFLTLINIRGTEQLIDAIGQVWESVMLMSDTEYHSRTRTKIIQCGVILQEMIPSKLAGVSFSRNPVTNQNEVVIEAIEGLGEDLVQKGVTPLRWRIRNRAVMEGNEHHHFFPVIRQVAHDTLKMKRHYGYHADIEWVWDGKKIYYLQVRQITARRDLQIYSNKMAKEMLPGQIKPLVWSVNIPLVNGTWIGLLSEITDKATVKPEDLARPFYYQTYFNVVALGRLFSEFGMSADSLEYLMIRDDNTRPSFRPGIRAFRHTFRMIRFIFSKMRFERTFLREFASLQKRYAELERLVEEHNDLGSRQAFLDVFKPLFEEGRRLAYLNIVTPILMSMHHKRLKKALAKRGVDYDKLDFKADFRELDRFNPLPAIGRIKRSIDDLPGPAREQCVSLEKLKSFDEASAIVGEFDDFLRMYGHLSDSGTDLSYPKWEEDPEKVFRMIMESSPVESGSSMLAFNDLNRNGIKIGSGLRRKYEKAGRFKVYREQISSFYIYGYGLFRKLFLRTGRHMAAVGLIADPEDIFYLSKSEVEEALEAGGAAGAARYRELIEARRQEMEATKDAVLPSVIYGEEAPILGNNRVMNHAGIGTSSGSFTGATRVVKGVGDFGSVRKGDVVLIPFSDVSWTPVLAKAGAIVSETGGLLSHCSIIARELGIPALVSVENACSFGNDLKVTVDGSNGVLTIHDHA